MAEKPVAHDPVLRVPLYVQSKDLLLFTLLNTKENLTIFLVSAEAGKLIGAAAEQFLFADSEQYSRSIFPDQSALVHYVVI